MSFPLIAVLATGCSEQSSTSKEAPTPPKVASQNQTAAKTGKAAKRKPKDMGSMTGPIDVVE